MQHDQDIQTISRDRVKNGGQVALLSGGRHVALLVAILTATLGMILSLFFLSSTRDTTRPEALAPILHLPFIRILLTTSLVILGSTIVAFAGLALFIVNTLICPKKSDAFIPLTPFALGIPAEEIGFSPIGGNHRVSGLFIPSPEATTTIIVCPGYRRTYKDVLGMCKHLWLAEHNVLVFEYYGHGSPTHMPVTLGYREINDFLGAVEYAKKREPQTRIGALGYSMGGAISIMGAARTHEVEAVVADSAFATHWSAVEMAVHRTLRFSAYLPAWTGRVLYWLTDQLLWMRAGYRQHQVEPVRDIIKIAPRPVLLIHGLNDTSVSPGDAHRLYRAARKPKALWLLPETEHCRAYFSESATYVTRVTDFFARHLKCSGQETPPTREQARQQPLPDSTSSPDVMLQKGVQSVSASSLHHDVERAETRVIVVSNTGDDGAKKQAVGQQAVAEQILRQVFAHVLDLPSEHVEVTSDFFQLGGDSDSLDALLFAIESSFQTRLTAIDIFENPVVFRLMALIRHKQQQALHPRKMVG